MTLPWLSSYSLSLPPTQLSLSNRHHTAKLLPQRAPTYIPRYCRNIKPSNTSSYNPINERFLRRSSPTKSVYEEHTLGPLCRCYGIDDGARVGGVGILECDDVVCEAVPFSGNDGSGIEYDRLAGAEERACI
jgi:hypothetical protein